MIRSVLQFKRFAVFRPEQAKLSEQDYLSRIIRLSRIPPWSAGPAQKVEIPGYSDLHSFSQDHTLLLQKNLGLWWPSFFRLGNWRIAFPVPRSGQSRIAEWLKEGIDRRGVEAVYITRFRPINHCLAAYAYRQENNGDLVFFVYDVNQPDKEVHLRYSVATRSFYYDKTWYYPGGLMTVMKLYVSPLI